MKKTLGEANAPKTVIESLGLGRSGSLLFLKIICNSACRLQTYLKAKRDNQWSSLCICLFCLIEEVCEVEEESWVWTFRLPEPIHFAKSSPSTIDF